MVESDFSYREYALAAAHMLTARNKKYIAGGIVKTEMGYEITPMKDGSLNLRPYFIDASQKRIYVSNIVVEEGKCLGRDSTLVSEIQNAIQDLQQQVRNKGFRIDTNSE